MIKATIAVIGANGRSGRAFIDAAVAGGFRIRAGIHNGTLPVQENVESIQIDATNPEDIAELFLGCDAVVSLIGHVKGSPPRVQSNAMRIIVAGMEQQGIRRIVSLTGNGVRFPGDRITLVDWMLNVTIKYIDANRVNDGVEHAAILQQSDLDWTLVRVLKLSNGPAGKFSITLNGPAKLLVPRETVGQAIVEILIQDEFIRQALIISSLRY